MLRFGCLSTVLATVVVLTGCGGTNPDSPAGAPADATPAEAIALAAQRTASESFEVALETPISWDGRDLAIVATGAFDLANGAGTSSSRQSPTQPCATSVSHRCRST
jgi:hypothetical protein